MASNENDTVKIPMITSGATTDMSVDCSNATQKMVATVFKCVMTRVCDRIEQLEKNSPTADTSIFYSIANFVVEPFFVAAPTREYRFIVRDLNIESLKELKNIIQEKSGPLATKPAAFFSTRADTLYNCIKDIEYGINQIEKGPQTFNIKKA